MASQQNVSKSNRPISFVGMNVNQVKSELAAQLSNQEQLLAKLGTSQISRNAFLKQSDMIRKELQDLNKYNQQDELPTEIREKLETLANEFQHIKATKVSNKKNQLCILSIIFIYFASFRAQIPSLLYYLLHQLTVHLLNNELNMQMEINVTQISSSPQRLVKDYSLK